MTDLLTHYREMLDYDIWANAQSLASIETIPAERRSGPAYDRLTALIPHNLIARRVWRWRILEQPYENPPAWFPPMSVEQTRALMAEVDEQWKQFLPTLSAADLDRSHSYKTSEGTPHTRIIRRSLTHVFNHGTYHRGQVARLVTEHGGTRAGTDFMLMFG